MGTVFVLIGYCFLSFAILSLVGICAVGTSTSRVLLVLLANLFLSWPVVAVATNVVTSRLMKSPPPRPMFCNRFGFHERVLLPIWFHPMPAVDRHGNWVWADFEDNLLVIVVNADPPNGTSPQMTEGLTETTFSSLQGQTHTVRRDKNRLVIIRPSLRACEYQIAHSDAMTFFDACQLDYEGNHLLSARTLLPADAHAEYDRCLEPPGD